MASVEEFVDQIKFLQQQNEIRAQEAQALQKEVQTVTTGYQEEINKLKKEIIDLIKRQQEEEQDSGYKKSNFHDKDAKDFKPEKWAGEKDKVNFREYMLSEKMMGRVQGLRGEHDDEMDLF